MKITCTNKQKNLLIEILAYANDCCFDSPFCVDRNYDESIEDFCKKCIYKNIEWDIVED